MRLLTLWLPSLFLLLLSSFSSAASDRSSHSLPQALKLAQDQQFEFKDSEAILTLETALAEFEKKSHPKLTELSRLADAYLFLALCHRNLKNTQAMRRSLEEAARLNPNLIPNERVFPPSLVEQFEQAKDRVWAKGPFASVRIESIPPQASVFVNGAFKGKTPLKLNRHPVGIHYVSMKGPKGEAYRKIELKTQKDLEIRLRLKRL